MRKSHRGAISLGILALSLVTAGLAALALSSPGDRAVRPSPLALARTAYENRDFDRSERLLESMDSPEADLIRAKIRRETGRLDEARDLFAKVLKAKPNDAEAVQGLAQVYTALRRPDAAAALWRRLTELQPDNPWAHRDLGFALLQCKDRLGALYAFQRSLELRPDQSDLNGMIAEIATVPLREESTVGAKKRPFEDPNGHFPQPSWKGGRP